MCLIGTGDMPLAALHANTVIPEHQLPIRFEHRLSDEINVLRHGDVCVQVDDGEQLLSR